MMKLANNYDEVKKIKMDAGDSLNHFYQIQMIRKHVKNTNLDER